jgi:hypothetical protein
MSGTSFPKLVSKRGVRRAAIAGTTRVPRARPRQELARCSLSISPFETPLSTKNWLCERSPRGYMLRSCVRARTSTHQQGPRRSVSFFQLPPLQASRAVDRRVAAVPKFEAVERSASRFGPNPLSPKAPEELIVAVACPESTRRAQGVTLEAERTKAKSARCRGAPHRARFSVSRAFVLSQQEETKTGVEHYYNPLPSRKTRRAHSRRWS